MNDTDPNTDPYYSDTEENYIKLEDKYFELCERKEFEDSLGDI